MINDKKWIKELHDFFVKDENWDIACDTVQAVSEIETYWKQLFWEKVLEQSHELLDEKEWEILEYEDQVDIHPIKDKNKYMEHYYITIQCDEDDGCYYAIESDKRNKKLTEFSDNIGLLRADELFYKPQITPYLDRAQLGKAAKNNFEDAKKLVTETVEFIELNDVRNFLLTLK